jgi:hypothetical protein
MAVWYNLCSCGLIYGRLGLFVVIWHIPIPHFGPRKIWQLWLVVQAIEKVDFFSSESNLARKQTTVSTLNRVARFSLVRDTKT